MKARGAVIGWHDYRNTGDDAMLQVLLHHLNSRFQLDSVSVMTSIKNRLSLPTGIPTPRCVTPPLIPHSLKRRVERYRVRGADVMVFGGGSIFRSEDGLAWKNEIVRSTRERTIKAALGVSLGPFKSIAAERACEEFIKSLDCVVVRDSRSFEWASASAPGVPIFLAPDLAHALPLIGERMNLDSIQKGDVLGITLGQLGNLVRNPNQFLELLAASVLETAIAERMDEVSLIEFSDHPVFGDRGHLMTLRLKLDRHLASSSSDGPRITFRAYDKDPWDKLREVSSCRALLCVRFHGAVFAYMSRVPYVSLLPQAKTLDFIETWHSGGRMLKGMQPDSETLKSSLSTALHSSPPEQARYGETVLAQLDAAL